MGGTIFPPLSYLILTWCIMNYQYNLSFISPCWMEFTYISPLSNENSIVKKNYSPVLFFTPPYMSYDTFVICLSGNNKFTIIWSNIILVHLNKCYNSLGCFLLLAWTVCDLHYWTKRMSTWSRSLWLVHYSCNKVCKLKRGLDVGIGPSSRRGA